MKPSTFALVLMMFFGLEAGAMAYKVKRTESGALVRWNQKVITYSIHANIRALPEGPHFVEAIKRGFVTWEKAVNKRITLSYAGESNVTEVGYDANHPANNENTIMWQTSHWEHHPDAMAITLVSYHRDTGTIVDADMVFNGVNYRWYVHGREKQGAGAPAIGKPSWYEKEQPLPLIEVENTAAHEIGHFLGLSHSEKVQSTMYHAQSSKEITKRQLHGDDLQGIRILYPKSFDGKNVDPISATFGGGPVDVGLGCSATKGVPFSRSIGWGLLLLLLPLGLGLRRKTSSSLLAGLLVCGSVGLLAPEMASANSVVPMKLTTVIKRAKHVVSGHVVSQQSFWVGKRIYTLSKVSVETCHKGTCTTSNVMVQQLGGVVGKIGMFVQGLTMLKPKQHVMLFLYAKHANIRIKGKAFPVHRLVGMSQGLFRYIKKGKDTQLQYEQVVHAHHTHHADCEHQKKRIQVSPVRHILQQIK